MRHGRIITLLIVGCIARCIPVSAAVSDVQPLRVAVLTDEKLRSTPLAELVQAAILAEPLEGNVSFVERDEITRLTREQELSAAFAVDKPGDRAKLGRLLKADILVILRSIGTVEPGVEVVACETARGLRLAIQPVAVEKDLATTAASVKRVVLAALKKGREQIVEIVAVTPFVCHDLTFDFEHLKTVYARLLEQSLLARPGVLVVELPEADGVASEAVLAGQELSRRPLPLYVYGEYRTQSVATKRTVQVSMSLKRGPRRIATIETAALPLDQVAGVLEETLAEWMNRLPALEQAALGTPTTLTALPPRRAATSNAAATQEAAQLAERAGVYERVAYWEEASALYEASLLLDATHGELHRRLAITLHHVYMLHKGPHATLDALRSKFAVYERVLNHLELYLRWDMSPPSVRKTPGIPYEVLQIWPGTYNFRVGINAPLLGEAEAMATRTRETVLRFIPIRARTGHSGDLGHLFSLVAWASQWKTVERYARMQKIIDEIQDCPRASDCVYALVYYGNDVDSAVSPEGQAFVKRLAESPNPDVRKSGIRLVNNLPRLNEFVDRAKKLMSRANTQPATLPVGPAEISYAPLHLTVLLSSGMTQPAPSFQVASGCLPVSDGVDVFWTGGQLFVMKQKGILKRAWSTDEPYATLRDLFFDGKYVWAALVAGGLNKNPEPLVLALDPASEEIIKFTAADGLPPIGYRPGGSIGSHSNSYLSVGPLEPGKACACGSMGRTWIAALAITSVDGKKAKSVRVFHEAKEANNPEDKERWGNTHVAFIPGYFLAATDPKTGRKTLLLNRGELAIEGHPLQIDCQTLDVQPWRGEPLPIYTLARGYHLYKNALYYLTTHRPHGEGPTKIGLFRAELPDLKLECLCENVSEDSDWPRIPFRCPDGRWLLLNDRVGIHGADSERGPFHVLRGGMPDILTGRYDSLDARLWSSHHYGIIFYSTKQRLYKVSFKGEP